MKPITALLLADIHYAEWHRWQTFLKLDPGRFDVIVCLGDIDILYLEAVRKAFADKPMIGINGNHDHYGDISHFGVTDLHGKTAAFRGLRFAGVEGCVRYKAGVAPIHDQGTITALLASLPAVDVIIGHNSPFGIHDKPDLAHVGYEGLNAYIQEHRPRYVFHGHQHRNQATMVGDTEVIGVYGGILFDFVNGHREQVLKSED